MIVMHIALKFVQRHLVPFFCLRDAPSLVQVIKDSLGIVYESEQEAGNS